MPGGEYLKDPETVTGWKFGLTTVDWRKEDLEKRLARSRRLVSGEEEIDLKLEHGPMMSGPELGLQRREV